MDKNNFDFDISRKEFKTRYINVWLTEKQLYNKWYRITNIERLKAYDKQYNVTHKEKKKEKNIRYYQENKERLMQYQRDYRKHNLDKCEERNRKYYEHNKKDMSMKKRKKREEMWYKKIHDMVQRELKKRWWYPDRCTYCGKKKKNYAHHPNYDKWNEVVFLCSSCHQRVHNWEIICPKPIDILTINSEKENATK